MNSSSLEPTRTLLISGFSNFNELEKYRESVFSPETMSEHYSVAQSNILFLLFFDLRDSVKFFNLFKRQSFNANLNISYTISKFELPRKHEECSEKNKQSTVMFEFVGMEVRIEDNFIVNFLKQYGDVKDLKGSSPYLKVIEFYSINDARKAFKALNGSPFATGEIQCKWDWDITSSTRTAYIKLTDEFIKKSMSADDSSSEQTKRIRTESIESPVPVKTDYPELKRELAALRNDSPQFRNEFIGLFDKFIFEHLSDIEDLFSLN